MTYIGYLTPFEDSQSARQQRLQCFYKMVLCDYLLGNLYKVKTQVDVELAQVGSLVTDEIIKLYNLRGATCYRLSCLASSEHGEERQTLLQLAQNDLQKVYTSDQTQSYVYLLMRFLQNDHRFIVRNIPHPVFKPIIELSVSPDLIFSPVMLDACAYSCIHEKDYKKALSIYRYRLEHFKLDPSRFIELAMLHINCAETYRKCQMALPSPGESELKLQFILEETIVNEDGSKEEKTSFRDETLLPANVSQRILEHCLTAKEHLEAISYFNIEPHLRVRMYIDVAALFEQSSDLATYLNSDKLSESELKALASSNYNKAIEFSAVPDCDGLIQIAREKVAELASSATNALRV